MAIESSNPIRDSSRGAPPNPDEQVSKIYTISSKIVRSLEADEAKRARLVVQEENEKSHKFYFEISRNTNLEEMVSRQTADLASQEEVNLSALRRALEPYLNSFQIPEGHTQKIYVDVPKDPEANVTYGMVTSPEGDDPLTLTEAVGPMLGGTASKNQPNWRYEHLLNLDIQGDGVGD